jgi:hypothetical protein
VRSLTVKIEGRYVVLVADDPAEEMTHQLFLTGEAARRVGELLVEASRALEVDEIVDTQGVIFPPKVGDA